jgi:predicted esterase YcpF (UPF0227 family)
MANHHFHPAQPESSDFAIVGLKQFTNGLDKRPQVAQMLPQYEVQLVIVYLPIHVNQHVAKSGHLLEVFTQIWGYHASFTQNGKTFCVLFRNVIQSPGTDVEANLQGSLDRDQQTITGHVKHILIRQKHIARQRSDPIEPI